MVYDPHNESYLYVIDRYNDKLVRWHIAHDDTSQFVGSDESGAFEAGGSIYCTTFFTAPRSRLDAAVKF